MNVFISECDITQFNHVRKLKKRKRPIFYMWNLVSKLWVVVRNCNLIILRYFTFLNENFINITKASWKNSKPLWRYQHFLSREEDLHVHPPPPQWSVKWRKTINEMDGNIPGGNFLGGNFPGGDFPRTVSNILFKQATLHRLKTNFLTFYESRIVVVNHFEGVHLNGHCRPLVTYAIFYG